MLAEPALEHLQSWDLIRVGLLAKSSTAGDFVVALRVADQSKHLVEVETAGLYRAAAAAARCALMVVFETDDSESAADAGHSKLVAEVEIVDSGSELADLWTTLVAVDIADFESSLADLWKTLVVIDIADFESSLVAVAVPIAAVSEIVV